MQSNPSSLNLAPLQLPQEPGFWPMAWGWWMVAVLIIIAIAGGIFLFSKFKKRNEAKRIALNQLKQTQSLKDAMLLLRQAALSYFPREHIASLSGTEWYVFLDKQLKAPRFVSKAKAWDELLYKGGLDSNITPPTSELMDDIHHWINHALPPRHATFSVREDK